MIVGGMAQKKNYCIPAFIHLGFIIYLFFV